jgi:hypothetical protein
MLWHRRAVFTSLRLSQGENGDLLGVGSAKRQLRTLLFYPNIYGVPKWYTTLPPSYRTPQGRIDQVSSTSWDVPQGITMAVDWHIRSRRTRPR